MSNAPEMRNGPKPSEISLIAEKLEQVIASLDEARLMRASAYADMALNAMREDALYLQNGLTGGQPDRDSNHLSV